MINGRKPVLVDLHGEHALASHLEAVSRISTRFQGDFNGLLFSFTFRMDCDRGPQREKPRRQHCFSDVLDLGGWMLHFLLFCTFSSFFLFLSLFFYIQNVKLKYLEDCDL